MLSVRFVFIKNNESTISIVTSGAGPRAVGTE